MTERAVLDPSCIRHRASHGAVPTMVALALMLATASPVVAKSKSPPPREDAPREATGCEAVGKDYVKLPGSDTCVKVSGSARSEGGAIFGR